MGFFHFKGRASRTPGTKNMNVSEVSTVMTEIKDATFDETVLHSKKPVLLYFWADTCRPCKIMKPEIDDIVGELGEKLEFTHTDAVENDDICQKCGVMSTPTLMLFHNGEPVMRLVGYVTKEDLRARLDSELNKLS